MPYISRVSNRSKPTVTGRLFTLFILIVIDICAASRASAADLLRFDSFKLNKGTIQNEITGIVQDRRGFIWFATRFGLVRYDGRGTLVLRHEPDTPHFLSSDSIEYLVIDSAGYLWLGMESGGIDCVEPESLSVISLTVPPAAADVQPAPISAMIAFGSGILVATNDGRLYRADAQLPRMTRLDFGTPPSGDASISNLFADSAGYLWIGRTAGSLQCLDSATGKPDPRMAGLSATVLSRVDAWMLRDRAGDLWGQLKGGGIARLRHEDNSVEELDISAIRSAGTQPFLIECMLEDEDDIFIGTAHHGLLQFNRGEKVLRQYTADITDPGSIRSDTIRKLFRDASGTMWIGTDEGVAKYSRHKNKFGLLRVPNLSRNGKAANISAIAVDGRRRTWIGTLDSGLALSDGESLRFIDLTGPGGKPFGNTVHALWVESDRRLLVALDEGLIALDTQTFAHEQLTPPYQITAILADRVGDLWISGYVIGLARVDRRARIARLFTLDLGSGRGQRPFNATCLFEDRAGNLWVGSDGDGAIRILPNRGSFFRYRHQAGATSSLSDDRILCITEDAEGTVWIGTRYGLNRFDTASGTFQRYFEADSLPDNVVCAIVPGAAGDIWLSSPNGLGRFNPRSHTGVVYDTSDGLQDERFNPLVSCNGPDGVIYFGGINGINSIDPAHLNVNRRPPPVVITSFRVAGEEMLRLHAAEQAVYRIPFEQNFFTIDYAVLDFTEPSRNRAAFQLEGYDENVRVVSGTDSVSYSRVPPGTYAFSLRGANNDGIWNETGASLNITIVPPFWMTIEFQGMVVVLVAAGIFSVYKIRTNAIKQQRNLLQREVDERRIAQARLEANQNRLRSLAVKLTIAEEQERRRIAQLLHDQIGQSLMMSMVRLDKLVSDITERKQSDEMKRVIKIINSVIVDTRSLTVELSPPSLYKFGLEAAIESLVEKFRKDNGINTVVLRGADSKLSKEASVLLFQAARELLVNVFKHAHAGRVEVKLDNDGSQAFIHIEDDGVGFDPAVVLNDERVSKGFGLFSFQEQIENIGGSMVIDSAPGAGTRITLSMPLGSGKGADNERTYTAGG